MKHLKKSLKMAGSLTKAGQKLSRLKRSFVYAPNVPYFMSAALDTEGCFRCGTKITEDSLYAMLGQITRHRVSGGMLCAKCGAAFRRWMKEGEKDG